MWKLAIPFLIILVLAVIFIPVSAYAYDSANVTSVDVNYASDLTISGLDELEDSIASINTSINFFTDTLQGFFYIIPLLAISILAFWKENPILFILAFGLAWLTGLNAPDILSGNTQTTTMGLTLGLMVIGYALFCAVMAFSLMFLESRENLLHVI